MPFMQGIAASALIGTAAVLGGAYLYVKNGPRRHRASVGLSTGLVVGQQYGALAGLAVAGPGGALVGSMAGGIVGAVVGHDAATDGMGDLAAETVRP
jgi:hypothetical protein